MKKILSPIDFSDVSINALHYAANIAQEIGAELMIFHAIQVPIPDANTPVDISSEMMVDQRASAEEKINELAQELAQKYFIKITHKVVYGLAATSIDDACKEFGCTSIVMGTKGSDSLVDRFFGTMSAEVIRKTDANVLIVPENATYRKMDKVMYATDLKEDDSAVLEDFAKFTAWSKPELHVVHVEEDDNIPSGQFEVYKEESKGDVRHVDIKSKQIEEGLITYADAEKIDMLALRKHKYKLLAGLFHKSLTNQISLHTHVPLLIYHEA